MSMPLTPTTPLGSPFSKMIFKKHVLRLLNALEDATASVAFSASIQLRIQCSFTRCTTSLRVSLNFSDFDYAYADLIGWSKYRGQPLLACNLYQPKTYQFIKKKMRTPFVLHLIKGMIISNLTASCQNILT